MIKRFTSTIIVVGSAVCLGMFIARHAKNITRRPHDVPALAPPGAGGAVPLPPPAAPAAGGAQPVNILVQPGAPAVEDAAPPVFEVEMVGENGQVVMGIALGEGPPPVPAIAAEVVPPQQVVLQNAPARAQMGLVESILEEEDLTLKTAIFSDEGDLPIEPNADPDDPVDPRVDGLNGGVGPNGNALPRAGRGRARHHKSAATTAVLVHLRNRFPQDPRSLDPRVVSAQFTVLKEAAVAYCRSVRMSEGNIADVVNRAAAMWFVPSRSQIQAMDMLASGAAADAVEEHHAASHGRNLVTQLSLFVNRLLGRRMRPAVGGGVC